MPICELLVGPRVAPHNATIATDWMRMTYVDRPFGESRLRTFRQHERPGARLLPRVVAGTTRLITAWGCR